MTFFNRLEMVNYEFFDMIVAFLEREEQYKNYKNFIDKNTPCCDLDGSYDQNDDLSRDLSDGRLCHNQEDPDDRIVFENAFS